MNYEEIKPLKEETIVVGSKINLVPFSDTHLQDIKYLKWLHDYEIIKHLNLPSYVANPVTFEEVKSYIENMKKSKNNLFFAIETKEGNFIGTFKIGPIDWHTKNVNLGIMIGDKSSWGKGIASEAFSIAIDFCFQKLKMHKITGGCMEPNIGMKKIFERLGFKEEGCFREQDFLEEKYHHHLHYGLLRKEYEKLKANY